MVNVFTKWPKTNKDVQRGRATDANYLASDMDQLRKNLFDVGITTEDGRFVVIPEDRNKIDGIGGWYARAKLIQMDEKGQFFYYDNVKGCMARSKFGAVRGASAVFIGQDNREQFTYVPWCDTNGVFLFCQIIFKGTLRLEGHLTENLATAPVMVQYTKDGNQSPETFKFALIFLHARLRKVHDNDPLICGPDVIVMVTTDGHYTRKADEVLLKGLELNIHVQVRYGASSFITQMWDQVFHKFADEYNKLTDAIVAVHRAERTNTHASFKMTKQYITGIIASLHQFGNCAWCSRGCLLEAFDKVGITYAGLNTNRLLENPLVTNSNNAALKAARFKSVSLPTPRTVLPRPAEFQTPPGMRRTMTPYSSLKVQCLQAKIDNLLYSPQDIAEAQAEMIAPTPFQLATAVPLMTMIDDDSNNGHHLNIGQVSGNLSQNAELLGVRAQQRAARATSTINKQNKDTEYLALRTKYFSCEAADPGTCGCVTGCPLTIYKYCRMCDLGGRPALQKSRCRKQACLLAQVDPISNVDQPTSTNSSTPPQSINPDSNDPLQTNADTPPLTTNASTPSLTITTANTTATAATTTSSSPSSSTTNSLIFTSLPSPPPQIAPCSPTTSSPSQSTISTQDMSDLSSSLPSRLHVVDPEAIQEWNEEWVEDVFTVGDRLIVKFEDDGSWLIGDVKAVKKTCFAITYHKVGGGFACVVEYLVDGYFSKARYGSNQWWMFMKTEPTVVFGTHMRKKRKKTQTDM
eukprot:m.56874 g.56874  ORF g.56874 m.56874 type:complete len:747 (+) comp22310_c1_seq1:702-2942(+)